MKKLVRGLAAASLLVFTVTALSLSKADAATLQVKVDQVESGNSIVVSNTSRSLRVRIKGIVPPEPAQPFSEAARDHLKQLVLGKAVVIDYTDLAGGYLQAKVYLNQIDIASQMLRDGVAWYDRTNTFGLSDRERSLYDECEQAARTEKRGLWQDPSPISPWDFRKIQLEKAQNAVAPSSFREVQDRKLRSQKSLSNADLLGSMIGSGSNSEVPSFQPIASDGSADRWMRFNSTDSHFSVSIPSNAVEASYTFPDPEGKLATFHYLAASVPETFYLLVSGTGPGAGASVDSYTSEVLKGYVDGINRSLQSSGADQLVTAKPVRDVKLAGFIGKQFSLNGPGFTGQIKILSKPNGDRREIFILCVMTRSGASPASEEFLNSFKIN